MSSNTVDKGYEPQEVEKRWYAFWEENQLFAAAEEGGGRNYSIVIPPPNVTGVLHMGHALNITIQDILCRYRRLRGDNVLWMPGTDHAGIATQNVVEKKLAEQGKSRHQLGREKFVEAVWKWREEYGNAIIHQLKRLGASCDWKRERFTMDEGLSKAVKKVFVQLYEEGLIYRGKYIINWCPRCLTALADLEVDHEELEGHLYHIRYPYTDGSGHLVIATTRPETMLGDTAVAVNPEDSRYHIPDSGSIKTHVVLPLTGRTIPIIKDAYVDMSFGTGALKVTPAHDPNDFEIGKRHGLEILKVIGDDGLMTADAGKFEGLDRFTCRKAIVEALTQEGLLEKMEPYTHGVGHCYRCKTVVEPNLSDQWFVSAKPLAKKAIASVQNGDTRIIPETWANTYFDWMYNIRDWCISRQIWWGHQIPAWTCGVCGKIIVSVDTPERCPDCNSDNLIQDTDVLDTWFSSALWPFSTMGWPDETPLLKTFYPTAALVTGFDILFFWVARMMMMGTHFMGEVPFRDVYVHALVRDEYGKKMSKSKGNVIDPLGVIDLYGTDAFRFTLAAFAAQGRDIKMSENRVEGYRHFINKLWNAARFAFMHIKNDDADDIKNISRDSIELPDRWILSRLNRVASGVTEALDTYRFNDAAGMLYQFVWHEFCDWYLESVKPVLYGKKGAAEQKTTKAVLRRVLHDILILLHPFIPFVTEEIWHMLPGTDGSIMKASWPEDFSGADIAAYDAGVETDMSLITGVITGIRNIRGEMNISPSKSLNAIIQSEDITARKTVEQHKDLVIDLARLESLSVNPPGARPKSAATALAGNVTIFVLLEGIIDFSKEAGRLEKEIAKLETELSGVRKKLENGGFLSNAPEDVVEKVKNRYAELLEKQEKLQVNLDKIKKMQE